MKDLENFKDVTVLVIGDVMLDRFWWGSVDRISPEAPVPIVKINYSTDIPGGAANVAANISGLGAKVKLVGVIGTDVEAETLIKSLQLKGVPVNDLVSLSNRSTTVKTRIIANGQQVVRLDQEADEQINQQEADTIFESLKEMIVLSDVILISDYAKGLLTNTLLSNIIEFTNNQNKPVLVDPKGKDYTKYSGATLLTPNKREAADAAGLDHNSPNVIDKAGERLFSQISISALLITKGEDGMTLFEKDKQPHHLDALAREVFDVTGAGDTVIATLAVALGSGHEMASAAYLSNVAARIVVGQIGTTAITFQELQNAVKEIIAE